MSKPDEVENHRLEASKAAEQAVRLDQSDVDDFMAAQFYESAAEHLSSLLCITGCVNVSIYRGTSQ